MDLTKYQSLFEINQIDGSVISAMNDVSYWRKLGLEKRDYLCALYNFEMMKSTGYWKTFSPNYEHDCCVCYHLTPEKTIHLLKEYDIPIEDDIILRNKYTAPILIFLKDLSGNNNNSLSQNEFQILPQLDEWKNIHEKHLKDLNTN